MKFLTITGLLFMVSLQCNAQELLKSKVFRWEDMPEIRSLPGKKRSILEGSSTVFSYLEVHATILFAGNKRAPLVHKHPEHEELIVVKEGVLDATLKGKRIKVPAGGVILACPGDDHIISNGSEKATSYYIFRWKSGKSRTENTKTHTSAIWQWNDLKFIPDINGGRRDVMNRPTALLTKLEMHVTTLNKALQSQTENQHSGDEFILVKSGEAEFNINGIPHKVQPGTLIYVTGNNSHSIRNTGKGQCEYYAIRME